MQELREIECEHLSTVPEMVLGSSVPLVLRGLVADWPATQVASKDANNLCDYITSFDRNLPLTVYRGDPQIEGRIFYNDDFTGFNFDRLKMPLCDVLEALAVANSSPEPSPSFYVGSTMIDHWLPGFREDNDLALDSLEPLVSLWFGNQSKVAAHYDFPNNVACNVAGRRRFTLFPPEQADNLYVGPIDLTPSGQAISLVDTTNPDLSKYPNYELALESGFYAELTAGDAIYIPSMWWHHVQALDDFNVLVNYWWRSTPAYLGAPANALMHSVMTMSGLPSEQKKVWKEIFARYVFNDDLDNFDHIPEHARGALDGVDEKAAKAIKARLVHFLK